LFWVPADAQGVSITPLPKLGMRSMGSCSVVYDNVFVADENVLAEPHNAWYTLLPTLNNERIMVGAFCLGVIDGVLEDALAYVMQRKAFGRYIGEFQALQHYIADIATMQKTTELLLYFCASKQARGEPVGNEANMLKLNLGGLIFLVLLLIVAIALINNTIRLAIYSKRFLIRTMHLVGATPWFIKRPFLVQGFWQGMAAAVLAVGVMVGLVRLGMRYVPDLLSLTDVRALAILFAGVLVLGLLISMASTWFAVGRYLRMNSEELHWS
jgi:alkylation response protein AidB-like acyl-CoA dehydrogenase